MIISPVLSRLKITIKFAMMKAFSRLPTNVIPSHNVIKLKPNLTKFTFTGEVVVQAKVLEPVPNDLH